jgi:hypothetical protein
MKLDPKKSLLAIHHGHVVASTHTADKAGPQPVLDKDGNQIGERFGLPDGHDGWDHVVLHPTGHSAGTFHNLGEAIAAAAAQTNQANQEKLKAASAPPGDALASSAAGPNEPAKQEASAEAPVVNEAELKSVTEVLMESSK